MVEGLANYLAAKDEVGRVQTRLTVAAAEVGRIADVLRDLAEQSQSVAERRIEVSAALLAALRDIVAAQSRSPIEELLASLEIFRSARQVAAEQYDALRPDEQIGLIPPPAIVSEV
jgi:hypothetical protein